MYYILQQQSIIAVYRRFARFMPIILCTPPILHKTNTNSLIINQEFLFSVWTRKGSRFSLTWLPYLVNSGLPSASQICCMFLMGCWPWPQTVSWIIMGEHTRKWSFAFIFMHCYIVEASFLERVHCFFPQQKLVLVLLSAASIIMLSAVIKWKQRSILSLTHFQQQLPLFRSIDLM